MMNHYFDLFVLPFSLGAIFLFTVIIYRYVKWIVDLDKSQKVLARRGFFSVATFQAIWVTIKESLLHVSIFKKNKLLGFMHASLAFGWFLLIIAGAMETNHALKGEMVAPYVHIFFKYFVPTEGTDFVSQMFVQLMDALLLLILTGVGLAWYKRFNSKRLGMKKTTKQTKGDKIALTALWLIFPVRLLAESITGGLHDSGGFLTNTLGTLFVTIVPREIVSFSELPVWWLYSLSLGVFFVALPYSRYMHIFTEVPHIFLKQYGVRPLNTPSSVDNFDLQSCSRCGICIDACQLQMDFNITKQLPVYFLRNKREKEDMSLSATECLMCGRCENACPVHVDINKLRQSSRVILSDNLVSANFSYLKSTPIEKAKIGYFSGCMTKLTPAIISSMKTIFEKAGQEYSHIDSENGICCGRPLMLAGELDKAKELIDANKKIIKDSGVDVLVTSCPICLKVFREEYALENIEVIHHTQYIERLIEKGMLKLSYNEKSKYTYHDPCELGRGSNIYEEPRKIIQSIGTLVEADSHGSNALCCGSSLAHTSLTKQQKHQLADRALDEFVATGAQTLVTACPLCKSAFITPRINVIDIAEVVVQHVS